MIDLFTDLLIDDAVCRTAPAATGLSKNDIRSSKVSFTVCRNKVILNSFELVNLN